MTRNRTPKRRKDFLKKTFEKTQDFLNRNRSWMEYHQRIYLHNPYYLWKTLNYFTSRRVILDQEWNFWKKVGTIIFSISCLDGSLNFVRLSNIVLRWMSSYRLDDFHPSIRRNSPKHFKSDVYQRTLISHFKSMALRTFRP